MRGTVDRAVSIDAVKKFIAEQDLKAETRYVPEVVIASNRYDHWEQKIAVIGAGPAGLSCAYYLATKGYKPTVFEKNEKPGGMMRYGIPSYKLEKDVIDAEIDIIKELGVEIKCGIEVGRDITLGELRKQGFKAFYIAVGCQGGRMAGVCGEDAAGLDIAVNFLHDAIEHNDRKIDGDAVVIGGGNVAVDCARTAHRFGASKVSMVCLESRETMPASKEEIDESLEENIEIVNGFGPKEVLKDENGNVKAVVFKKCIRTIDPETGKFSPLYDENDTLEIPAKRVIYAIGQSVEWGDMLKDENVEFHHGNYPLADGLTFQTSQPDVFVGGDVYTGPKFAIDAIAAGREGAVSLHRYVHENCTLTIGRNRRDFIELDKENIKVETYDSSSRQIPPKADVKEQAKTFRDLSQSLSEEQVKKETSRCLSCGASVVDPNKCIGCGICTTKCMFDAIHLHRELPGASVMHTSEEKLKYILPNMVKQSIKVKFKKKK